MEINIMQVLFQAVNFGLIFFVLVKYLYKPVLKLLDDRAVKINDGLKAAEKNLKSQTELEEAKAKELTKARREATKLLADAKAEAKLKANEYLKDAKAKAHKEVEAMLANAKSGTASAEKKMAESLKDLTITTTKKLLAESLSAKEIKSITDRMVKKLK